MSMRRFQWNALLCVALGLSATSAMANDAAPEEEGAAIYRANCATCHDMGERAPAREQLRQLSPEKIYEVITVGKMAYMAPSLSESQRRVLSRYLGGAHEGSDESANARLPACESTASRFDYSQPTTTNGFGISGPENTRSVPALKVDSAALSRIQPAWSFSILGATFPTVAGGAVFTAGASGDVYALDARTGCVRWRYDAGMAIRSGVILEPWSGSQQRPASAAPLLYVGDRAGFVHAVNAVTGKIVWRVKAHPHELASILATPNYYKGRLYVGFSSTEGDIGPSADPHYGCCTFRGLVAALDARTGKILWRAYTIREPAAPRDRNSIGVQQYGPSGAAVLGTPTIDAKQQRLYFTGDNDYSDPRSDGSNTVISVDLKTGHEIWRRKTTAGNPHNAACYRKGINCPKAYDDSHRTDWGFKAPPVLARGADGREVLIAAQKSGQVWGLDPGTGAIRWETKLTAAQVNYGALQGIALDGVRVLVPTGDFLKSPANGPYPGIDELGLYSLDVATGAQLWKAPVAGRCDQPQCKGYYNAPFVLGEIAGIVSNDNFVRFYATQSGELLQQFQLGKGSRSDGGSLAGGGVVNSGGGPAFSHDMMYLSSDAALIAYTIPPAK